MTTENKDNPKTQKPASPKNKVVLIFIVALLGMAALAIFRNKPPSIPWIMNNHDEGVQQAHQQHKPLLVAFMGDTPNCSWMERDCHHNKAVVDFVQAFVPIWIKGEENPQLVAKYNVTAYPTYVIKWPDGEEDSRIIAHSSPTAFIEKLQTGLDRIGPEPKMH